MSADPFVIVAAFLLVAGVLLSKTSSRFGVPSLLLFLLLGMLAGTDGVLGIEFDDFEIARGFGVIALAFILFSGGLDTEWRSIRAVTAPGVTLASVGVLLTATTVGVLASWILGVPILEGLLLGAIVSSTDAAAVFSVLRSRGVTLRDRLRPLLELESGSNDPAAVFLTVGVISLVQADGAGVLTLVRDFFWQMGLGVVAGVLLARVAARVINGLRLEYDGLYPVLTIAFVLLTYEGTTWLGGSGFLAAYVAGVSLGNTEFLHKRSLLRFHDAIAWLMQISMFVVLGLLVTPSDLAPVAVQGLLVSAVLILVARPLAVFAILLPFRYPWREVGFVSWVGLRGATPVILATFPVVAGVDDAETIFNVVFFLVITSVLVQGSTVPAMARVFDVRGHAPPARRSMLEIEASGTASHDLHEIEVAAVDGVVGIPIVRLGLPPGVLLVLVERDGDHLVPQGATTLEAGDRVLVLAAGERLERTRAILRGER